MKAAKGQSAASWFYGAPGFHSRLGIVETRPVELPIISVCSQCIQDGLTLAPDPSRYRRSDGLCGPHMDLMRVGLWAMVAARVSR